jgi:hypothetical protein
MNIIVTFREYLPSTTSPETQEEERGDFLGSFDRTFSGKDSRDLNEQIQLFLTDQKQETGNNIQVWEVKQ